ncbi:hypothetical protein [Pseudoalteromonas sp. SW0106-04]|uniref:hypothetical protein n=1 Tax=Pseudoalteromonas sp. SW0106-04 TaxID=1702169 RepID=UPI0006B451DD|nr:hypothetical protein [Pseudoalteromonas sp. SW0106-04]
MNFVDELSQIMDTERAQFVKFLRVEEGCSFRAVASECGEKWNQDWGTNQIIGEDLCAAAMQILNEKPDLGWN